MVAAQVSVVFWFWILGGPTFATSEPRIRSISVNPDAPVHIKPCEEVNFILDIIVDERVDPDSLTSVPSELVRKVVVNGVEYSSILSDVNTAATFTIDRSSIAETLDGGTSFNVAVRMDWNVDRNTCLFDVPGPYEIHFARGGKGVVEVESPTDEEKELLRKIFETGMQRRVFLTDLGGMDEPGLRRLEQWLKEYPNNTYSDELNIAVGLRLLDKDRGGPGTDVIDLVQRRERVAREYLEPYCTGDLNALGRVVAAYRLAEVLLQRSKIEKEMPQEKRVILQSDASALLKRVAESPLAFDYRAKAEVKLGKLSGSKK